MVGLNEKNGWDYRVANVIRYRETINCRATARQHFVALFDDDVSVGDYVVCDRFNDNYNVTNLEVNEVIDITDKCDAAGVHLDGQVICRVDISSYMQRRGKAIRIDSLRTQMDRMIADSKRTAVYDAMADRDPEFAKLLSEYNELV